MSQKSTSDDWVSISEAKPSNIESLTTILARAFHPVNPFIKETFPDTPAMRKWWTKVFDHEIESAASHPLVALEAATGEVIGILALVREGPDDTGSGMWDLEQLTPDHHHGKYKAMNECIAKYEDILMRGKARYAIQLFGMDHAFKGRGVATKLLARACEIADDEGLDVFVVANMTVRSFYERQGFSAHAEIPMPGGEYVEYAMVRPGKAT